MSLLFHAIPSLNFAADADTIYIYYARNMKYVG